MVVVYIVSENWVLKAQEGALTLQKYPIRLKQEVDYWATLHSCNAVKA